jgi:hypothetical protein
MIDFDDYEAVKQLAWYETDQGYIMTAKNITNKKLHRFVLGCTDDSIIDHINQNRKDNRKSNLRYSNRQLNGINRGCNKNNNLGVKGVSEYKGRYDARIMKDGREYYLGRYGTIELAKAARVGAEKAMFPELFI